MDYEERGFFFQSLNIGIYILQNDIKEKRRMGTLFFFLMFSLLITNHICNYFSWYFFSGFRKEKQMDTVVKLNVLNRFG